MKRVRFDSVECTLEGFNKLSSAYDELSRCFGEEIVLDFSDCHFFAANLAAGLGVIATRLVENLNTVTVTGLNAKQRSILARNGFLRSFGVSLEVDSNNTAIPYSRFKISEHTLFHQYVIRGLLSHPCMPSMGGETVKSIQKSLLEVFINVGMHSRSDIGVFCCGQLFPLKRRLDFTIADGGIGFSGSLFKKIGVKLSDIEALRQVVENGQTARTKTSGGLGIRLIREYIAQTNGRVQIASGDGYWEFTQGQDHFVELRNPFPGTLVNIEFNVIDSSQYRPPEYKQLSFRDLF